MSIEISKEFIDNYMTQAHPSYTLVYIKALSKEKLPSSLELANELRLTESDVDNAFSFWEMAKLLTFTDNKLQFHLENVEISAENGKTNSFHDTNGRSIDEETKKELDALLESKETAEKTNQEVRKDIKISESLLEQHGKNKKKRDFVPPVASGTSERDDTEKESNQTKAEKEEAEKEEFLASVPKFNFEPVETKPTYSPKEIERYMDNSVDIKILFSTAERLFGKALSTTEMQTLLTFHEYYRLPVEVIEEMLHYCITNGHSSWRYIEKVAMDWADSGIDTVEKAKNRINLFRNDYKEIMSALGLQGKFPIPKQKEFLDKWLDTGLDTELIAMACERAVLKTGEPSFPYADTIIKNWAKAGVKTKEDVEEMDMQFSKKQEASAEKRKESGSGGYQKKNTFANYNEREWDFDEIERKALEARIDSQKE